MTGSGCTPTTARPDLPLLSFLGILNLASPFEGQHVIPETSTQPSPRPRRTQQPPPAPPRPSSPASIHLSSSQSPQKKQPVIFFYLPPRLLKLNAREIESPSRSSCPFR